MPTFVDPNACNTCEGEDKGPLCVYICPNDLMRLEGDKGFNQEPNMCSECYACVKLCPTEAIRVRGYADFIPLGAEVQPRRVELGLTWTIRSGMGRKWDSPILRARNQWDPVFPMMDSLKIP